MMAAKVLQNRTFLIFSIYTLEPPVTVHQTENALSSKKLISHPPVCLSITNFPPISLKTL